MIENSAAAADRYRCDSRDAGPTWLLNQTASHATRLLTEGFAAHDLRGYHYRLLATLAEDGPASQADLGRRCGIDRSDVVAAINDLAGRGLVVRAPDPADRRRNVISSTEAGVTEARRLGDTLDRVQHDLLAPLSTTEREQLTRLLEHHRRP
ncbi:MarR family winged helix-turn-helix transcriptional regulator [Micromonospora sp. NPDC049230]|uniref:MarR family winged helix-turn-helix transcriptional regulator n=1 Tax=Micromonospora sp. NPDC049230 TaxID=3155502 RepID=UPI0033CCDC02